jgi:hypothetical protein
MHRRISSLRSISTVRRGAGGESLGVGRRFYCERHNRGGIEKVGKVNRPRQEKAANRETNSFAKTSLSGFRNGELTQPKTELSRKT